MFTAVTPPCPEWLLLLRRFINPDVEKQLLVPDFTAPSSEHHLGSKLLSCQNSGFANTPPLVSPTRG